MGTKNNPGQYDCYASLDPDEPHFILCARDHTAPMIVEAWAIQRSQDIDRGLKPESDRAKVKEAYQCAKAMRDWFDRHHKTKLLTEPQRAP